jgi:hypothetical protein
MGVYMLKTYIALFAMVSLSSFAQADRASSSICNITKAQSYSTLSNTDLHSTKFILTVNRANGAISTFESTSCRIFIIDGAITQRRYDRALRNCEMFKNELMETGRRRGCQHFEVNIEDDYFGGAEVPEFKIVVGPAGLEPATTRL